jgi:predicted  nucleic acid-binding Zn-ribbon protein
MILTCDNCGFIFSQAEETDQCPDCGKHLARPADEAEQEEFATRMAELTRAEHADRPRSPTLEDSEISMLNSFSFRVPATALHINSTIIVDVVVEYGENPADRTELAGNAWARQEGGTTGSFLMAVHLPIKQGETPKEQVDRIFAALNGSGASQSQLSQFILEQLNRSVSR